MKLADKIRHGLFFHRILENGDYLAPPAVEAGFMSIAHMEAEIAVTMAAAGIAFMSL